MIKPIAAILAALSIALTACDSGSGSGSGNNSAAVTPANARGGAGAPASNDGKAAPAAAAAAGRLTLEAQGLRVAAAQGARAELLAFGSRADQVVEGLSGAFGARPTEDSTNQECGAGPTRIVQWANGFRILAQEARFVGWETDRPGQSFANGVAVGSTRREVDQAFRPEVATGSLGTGFSMMSGEQPYGGYLSGEGADGRVTILFAGITCHFD